MKRYTQTSGAMVETFNNFDGAPIGEWVRYDDIKHLLEPEVAAIVVKEVTVPCLHCGMVTTVKVTHDGSEPQLQSTPKE